jgi:hypothetical protein
MDPKETKVKPKTKPEPKVQFKLTIPQSTAKAFEATRKEADELGFDWTATMLEPMEKTNTEFSQFLARQRAKVQPDSGLTPKPRTSTGNSSDLDGHPADK